MATAHIYLKDLHFDHQLWLNELSFYKQETALLEKRLSEVVGRNTGIEATAAAEGFQNRFIRQREVIDELGHDIREREDWLVRYAQDHETAIDHVYFDNQAPDHEALAERVSIFKKLYAELKHDFLRYIGKWM